eukprot:g22066.t1
MMITNKFINRYRYRRLSPEPPRQSHTAGFETFHRFPAVRLKLYVLILIFKCYYVTVRVRNSLQETPFLKRNSLQETSFLKSALNPQTDLDSNYTVPDLSHI